MTKALTKKDEQDWNDLVHGKSMPVLHKREEDLRPLKTPRKKTQKAVFEATVDLHGRTLEQAHRSLISFLAGAFQKGRKTVLVITGKGLNSGTSATIKTETPRWLKEDPLEKYVRSFETAAIKDGGSGALYVHLKSRRR